LIIFLKISNNIFIFLSLDKLQCFGFDLLGLQVQALLSFVKYYSQNLGNVFHKSTPTKGTIIFNLLILQCIKFSLQVSTVFAFPNLRIIYYRSSASSPISHQRISGGCNLSDFHEMATNLGMKKARSQNTKNPVYLIDNGGRRLGIERREFAYSHYYPERRTGVDRRVLPERRFDPKTGD